MITSPILALIALGLARHGATPTDSSALPAQPSQPALAAPSPEVRPIIVPAGFQWDLLAREPLVADPVAFAIDEFGRIFVAESERQERGVEDNRHQSYWLLDDLSNETNEDRLRMYEKWAGKREGGMAHYTRWADRVRVLLDPDEHDRPTRSVNFSGDFNDPLDGTNAGVLARDGEVWVTCIPSLWRFRDSDGDGVADVRERVFDGFGVRIALRGHDMHGLVFGPDGRLYWSIGDRGYHITRADGRVLADPKSGAVFRCEPDGSNLEVFCTGLRNPQELAFNRYGDLFTGDNNSDAGDKARIVWCVDGGETGWDMNFQTLEGANQRGPWNQERMWTLWEESDRTDPRRAAFALPPLAHVGSGPSGVVMYPGLGLEPRYDDALFVCDFLGDRKHSRVLAMRLERDGAGYRVEDVHPFVRDVLPTDVDFDWSGRMLISDWDETWESNGKGQIYRVWDPRFTDTPQVREIAALVAQGFRDRSDDDLARLLAHADMRVRLRAQWELARRGPASQEALSSVLVADSEASRLFARLHAIWGLGQLLRAHREEPGADALAAPLVAALEDEEAEVRAQAARVLGDAAWLPALEPLIAIATDESPRVRFFTAQALGQLRSKEAVPALVAILWENDDENPYLRHAASLALARIGDREKLLELAADPFPQVRLGAVLALRRLRDPALARSLFDPELRIATEAARAIHDLPVPEARPALLKVAQRWTAAAPAPSPDCTPLLRRAINECLRDGGAEAAAALLGIAANTQVPTPMRLEALECLRIYPDPSIMRPMPPDGTLAPSDPPIMRDRVNGHVRPVDLARRDVEGYRRILSLQLPELADSDIESLRTLARAIAKEQSVALDPGAALATFADPSAPARDRAQCLSQLVRQEHPQWRSLLEASLRSDASELRMTARGLLAASEPSRAVEECRAALELGDAPEQQAALSQLAHMARTDADAVIAAELRRAALAGAAARGALALDLFEAASARSAHSSEVAAALAEWKDADSGDRSAFLRRVALEGGDALRGREVVNFHSAAACLRCHALDGHGGNAAPALDGIASRLTRLELLEALIDPNAAIADGYTAPSAMPDMRELLTPRELRDVVEYLSTLR